MTIEAKVEESNDEYGSKDAKIENEDEQRNTPPAGHTPREAHPWNWMNAHRRPKYHWEYR